MDIYNLYKTKVIDNKNFLLSDVIKHMILEKNFNNINIAVGYFYLSGIILLKEEITKFFEEENGNLHIIMGSETSRETAKVLDLEQDDFNGKIIKQLGNDLENIAEDDFLLKIRNWIKHGKFKVKIYTGSANYFHAKTYLFFKNREPYNGEAITGSSNLSISGLQGNTELNVLSQDNFWALQDWYDSLWNSDEVTDFSYDLLKIIDEKKPILKSYLNYLSVSETYYKFCQMYSKSIEVIEKKEKWIKELYEHQFNGINQILDKINRFGTSILSDGVGLGKTRTAAGVLKMKVNENRNIKALLIADSKLHGQWDKEFKIVNISKENYDSISREKFTNINKNKLEKFAKKYDFIIIDEVHQGFKNKNTKSYMKAKELYTLSSGRIESLLLTATPWNNSRNDILNIGSLFLNVNKIPIDRLYKQYFIMGNTNIVMNQLSANDKAFNQFWEDLFLQRTRNTIRSSSDIFAKRIFPENKILFDPIKNKLFSENFNRISNLKFPYFDPIRYIKSDSYSMVTGQMQLLLLKRADSSWKSYCNSIDNIIEKLKIQQNKFNDIKIREDLFLKKYFAEAYDLSNYSIERRIHESFDLQKYEEQFGFEIESEMRKKSYLENITHEIESITISKAKKIVGKIIKDIQHDIYILTDLRHDLFEAYKNKDEKLEYIISIIEKEINNDRKVMVVSQFKDTIQYYSEKLKGNEVLKNTKFGVIIGGKSSSHIGNEILSKEEILKRFSPISKNCMKYKNTDLEINLILGTDTISTGQNLQDATVIINLDLPYNPMQLEQRIGRIDRPRKTNDTSKIFIYTFPVYSAIEAELRMTERLGKKMEGVLKDTKFDSVVLPEYRNFLKNVNEKNAVQKMIDNTIENKIYKPKNSEIHSDEFIRVNDKMLNFIKNELPLTKNAINTIFSFSRGKSDSIVLLRINYKDINGSFLYVEDKLCSLNSLQEIGIIEAELNIYNELNLGLSNTKEFPQSESNNILTDLEFKINDIKKQLVDNYNSQIQQNQITINKIEHRNSKKIALKIREAVTNPANRPMILKKIENQNQTPLEVSKIAKKIEMVNKNHPIYPMIENLNESLDFLWDNFDEYVTTFNSFDDFSLSEEKLNIDTRKAHINKSEIDVIFGNLVVSNYRLKNKGR